MQTGQSAEMNQANGPKTRRDKQKEPASPKSRDGQKGMEHRPEVTTGGTDRGRLLGWATDDGN